MKILMLTKGATSEHTDVHDLFHKWTALKYEIRVSGLKDTCLITHILFGFMYLLYYFKLNLCFISYC